MKNDLMVGDLISVKYSNAILFDNINQIFSLYTLFPYGTKGMIIKTETGDKHRFFVLLKNKIGYVSKDALEKWEIAEK